MRRLRALHLDLEGKFLWEGGRVTVSLSLAVWGTITSFLILSLHARITASARTASCLSIGCKNTYIYIFLFCIRVRFSESTATYLRSYITFHHIPTFENYLKWMCPLLGRDFLRLMMECSKSSAPRKLHAWLSKEVRVMRGSTVFADCE